MGKLAQEVKKELRKQLVCWNAHSKVEVIIISEEFECHSGMLSQKGPREKVTVNGCVFWSDDIQSTKPGVLGKNLLLLP